mmetsp:Transcript_1145/g.3325  ORF Transcript_1145/g.3325 Transcript_1145/m.3325 type:complete len:145 (-) Transcript_1145:387-821(-)
MYHNSLEQWHSRYHSFGQHSATRSRPQVIDTKRQMERQTMEFGGHEEHCERYIVGSVARRAEDLALLLVLFQLSLSKMLESIISTVPARTTRSLALALPSIAHRRLAACFYRSRLLCNMVVVADGCGLSYPFWHGRGFDPSQKC